MSLCRCCSVVLYSFVHYEYTLREINKEYFYFIFFLVAVLMYTHTFAHKLHAQTLSSLEVFKLQVNRIEPYTDCLTINWAKCLIFLESV